jgi:hypothetical protein
MGKLYQKDNSPSSENKHQSGDFIVEVKNKDANWLEYAKKKMNSADSWMASMLGLCNDWACLSSSQPEIIAKEEIEIEDILPEYIRK